MSDTIEVDAGPLLSSRVELYLRPDDVAKMDTLVDALLANGAGTF